MYEIRANMRNCRPFQLVAYSLIKKKKTLFCCTYFRKAFAINLKHQTVSPNIFPKQSRFIIENMFAETIRLQTTRTPPDIFAYKIRVELFTTDGAIIVQNRWISYNYR